MIKSARVAFSPTIWIDTATVIKGGDCPRGNTTSRACGIPAWATWLFWASFTATDDSIFYLLWSAACLTVGYLLPSYQILNKCNWPFYSQGTQGLSVCSWYCWCLPKGDSVMHVPTAGNPKQNMPHYFMSNSIFPLVIFFGQFLLYLDSYKALQ